MAIIDRIKYDAASDDWFVWKHPSEELKIGSQLVVNQTQEAVLFKGGQALDCFGPGTHTLATGNIPLLGKLVNLPFGGQTPFTAEVWFVNKHAKRNMRWGTANPVPLMEPELGIPVNVQARGLWGVRVQDSRSLITQLVGTLTDLRTERIEEYFMGEIIQRFSDIVSRFLVVNKMPLFQVNAHLNELSQRAQDEIRPEFARFGLEVVNFNVQQVTILPEEIKKIQDIFLEKAKIEQISKAQVGSAYVTMRTFDTLEKAASTEGGTAGGMLAGGLGLGAGLGAGVPIGQQLGQALNPQTPQQPPKEDPIGKLQKLKQALDQGLINQDDFEARKKTILNDI